MTPPCLPSSPPADHSLDAVGDLLHLDPRVLLEASAAGGTIGRTP